VSNLVGNVVPMRPVCQRHQCIRQTTYEDSGVGARCQNRGCEVGHSAGDNKEVRLVEHCWGVKVWIDQRYKVGLGLPELGLRNQSDAVL